MQYEGRHLSHVVVRLRDIPVTHLPSHPMMSEQVAEEDAAPPSTSRDLSTLFDPPEGSFHRISQPFILRLPLYATVAGFSGFLLGTKKGGQDAGLRFRAEHAHRLPTTQTGWYLYHKSKNYHIALGGIYEGVRMSWRLAPWAGLFVAMEEGIDRGRATVVREWRSHRDFNEPTEREVRDERAVAGNKDFVSTMLAGLASAGMFAAWKRMPLPTAVRLMKLGAKGGFGFGLLQDVVNLLQGRRLGYVEFIKRHTFGTRDDRVVATAAAG